MSGRAEKRKDGQGVGEGADGGAVRGEDSVEIGGVSLPVVSGESGRGGGVSKDTPEARSGGAGFISLWFRCSSVYARGYKTRDGSAYFARCPKCGKTISLPIGAGGTTQRSFQVSCQ